MKRTEQSLLEQMRITDFEIASRKALFSITPTEESVLRNARKYIEPGVTEVVARFYKIQTAITDVALLIGDADTLRQLHNTQRLYILDLFSGFYDIEYIHNRLRIGLVHNRIGVEPKLYLAAVQCLRVLLIELIHNVIPDPGEQSRVIDALLKLIMFDVSLVVDTYIRGLITEIEIARHKSEEYARSLEEKVSERTSQLEELSRKDPMTGLLNVRYLSEILTRVLRAAQRRKEPVTLAYIDINDFKAINDTHGHQHGDEILKSVASALSEATRSEDYCFRYGGDEFCVVMSNCRIDLAKKAWEARLLELLQQHENAPKLSIGYSQTGPDDFVSPEFLIKQADEHMYKTKKQMKADNKAGIDDGTSHHVAGVTDILRSISKSKF